MLAAAAVAAAEAAVEAVVEVVVLVADGVNHVPPEITLNINNSTTLQKVDHLVVVLSLSTNSLFIVHMSSHMTDPVIIQASGVCNMPAPSLFCHLPLFHRQSDQFDLSSLLLNWPVHWTAIHQQEYDYHDIGCFRPACIARSFARDSIAPPG